MSLHDLDLELVTGRARELHGLLSSGIVRVVERHDPPQIRDHRFQQLQAFRRQVRELAVDSVSRPPGFGKLLTSPTVTGSVPA